MNLQEFLKELGLNKAQLSDKLNWSKQSLNQALNRKSPKLLLKLVEAFPGWNIGYDLGAEEYTFTKDLPEMGGAADYLPTILTENRLNLLTRADDLIQVPAIYSFIAAMDCEEIDLYFDTPAQEWVCVSEKGGETLAKFNADRVTWLAALLITFVRGFCDQSRVRPN